MENRERICDLCGKSDKVIQFAVPDVCVECWDKLDETDETDTTGGA